MRHLIYGLIIWGCLGLPSARAQQDMGPSLIALLNELQNPSPTTRIQAVKSLTRFEANKAVPILVKVALHDADLYVARYATRYVAKHKDETVVEEVLAALKHPDAEVREKAAMMVGILQERQGIPLLIACLNKDQVDVRLKAVWSLGKMRDLRASVPLMKILMNQKEDIKLRIATARALGQIGDVSAIEALVSVLQTPKLKGHVKMALRRIQRRLHYGEPIWQDLERVISSS